MEKEAEKLLMDFSHNGSLPGRAEIKVYVGNHFSDGQKLYLYYYNPDKKEIEPVQKNIVVVDGYATFELSHCSSYVLTDKEVKKAGEFPVPGEQNNSGNSGKNGYSQKAGTLTGDSSPLTALLILIIVATVAIVLAIWWKMRGRKK